MQSNFGSSSGNISLLGNRVPLPTSSEPIQAFARLSELPIQFGQLLFLLGRRYQHAIFAAANDRLLDIGEKRAERIEISRSERIELVIVALRSSPSSNPATPPRSRGHGRSAFAIRNPSAGRRPPPL